MHKLWLPTLFLVTLAFCVHSSAQEQETPSVTIDGTITSIHWHPDGEILAIGGSRGIWFVNTDGTIVHHELDPVIDLAWDSTGTTLAILHPDIVTLYNPSSWSVELTIPVDYDIGRYTYEVFFSEVNPLFWSNDGNYLTIVPQVGQNHLLVWNVEDGNVAFDLEIANDRILTVIWHPTLPYLVVGYINGTLDVWDVTTQDRIDTFNDHPRSVASIAWHPEGDIIASAGIQLGGCHSVDAPDGNSIFIWNANRHNIQHTLRTSQCGYNNAIDWHADGNLLAYTTQSGGSQRDTYNTEVRVFSLVFGSIISQMPLLEDEVSFVGELAWQPQTNNLTYRIQHWDFDADENRTCLQNSVGIIDDEGQELVVFEASESICGQL